MTAALQRDFPGVVVATVTVADVVDGTNSRAQVQVRYRDGCGPARVFVKREGRWLHRLALTALGAREAEARLAATAIELPLERPACYAAAVERRRLATTVVMEDVTLRGGVPNDIVRGLTVEQVASGLAGLARLPAAWWQRALPDFVRRWRLGRRWMPVSAGGLASARHRLRALGAADLVPAAVRTSELEHGFRGWADVAASGPQTLLHGDPHVGNTYTLPGDAVGFYDWQLVRAGSWAHDVGYFCVSSLDVADRRAYERDLLGAYLAELARHSAGGGDPVDAWVQYRRAPVYGLAAWMHSLAGRRFQPDDACLAMIERFAAAYTDHRRR